MVMVLRDGGRLGVMVCGELGEATQLRVVEGVEVAEEAKEGDLGARVDLAFLFQIVHDRLEVEQTFDLNWRFNWIVQSCIEPVVEGALHWYDSF